MKNNNLIKIKMILTTVIRSNFRKIHTKQYRTVPNSTKQYRTVLFLENYVVRTPVSNTVFFKILNMFDRIKLIKNYIY